jgi:predicted DNA-binding protein with PD1-like motif
MERQRTRYGYVLRLERGEEILETLNQFAASENIRTGLVSAIGAAEAIELGFFILGTREYVRRVFEGEYEIAPLAGNFSELDGAPFLHAHVTISGADFAAYAGHLFRGVVTATCEVQVVTDPGVTLRTRRPDLGFNPIRLERPR